MPGPGGATRANQNIASTDTEYTLPVDIESVSCRRTSQTQVEISIWNLDEPEFIALGRPMVRVM